MPEGEKKPITILKVLAQITAIWKKMSPAVESNFLPYWKEELLSLNTKNGVAKKVARENRGGKRGSCVTG